MYYAVVLRCCSRVSGENVHCLCHHRRSVFCRKNEINFSLIRFEIQIISVTSTGAERVLCLINASRKNSINAVSTKDRLRTIDRRKGRPTTINNDNDRPDPRRYRTASRKGFTESQSFDQLPLNIFDCCLHRYPLYSVTKWRGKANHNSW
jgi:hypothetical protein